MKTAILTAILPAAPILAAVAATEGAADPSTAQQGLWLIVGLSVISTITTIGVNIVAFRNSGRPVELSQPVLMEIRRELATREDVSRAKAFTARVQASLEEKERDEREELRRIYDKLDPLEAQLSAHTARLDALSADIRELRNRLG